MAEVDKLTLEIEDKASKSTDGIDTLITKLEKLEKQMDGTIPKMQKLANSFGGLNTTTKKAPNLTPSQQQGTNMSNIPALNKLSRAVNFTAFTAGAYKAGQAFSKLLGVANDYIETQNLFEVVMGDSTRQAWNFVESLESIGVNQEEAMRYQASFYDLANSLGVSSKNAYTLSTQFTKLAYDYASLYNKDPDAMFQKLQAGITGTAEPLRRLGKDVSEVRLQETARRLGIQESVRDMTQAQKTELRFIAIMEQSKSAMNDMERTIDQPANALRVLRAQLTSLARELGSLFIPALSAVLPYLIAFVKFIRTIVAEIAGFFGVKLKSIDFSGVNSQINNTAKGTGDTAKNLKKSADNAKKLKDYILGIDELNVLNDDGTVSRDTGASGSGSGGGVGDLGLDLSKYGYDDLLKNINSKANQIYETFMKWKKPLMIIAGILAGIWAIGKITNFIRALKGVQTTSNFVAGLQGIGGLARAFFNLAGSGGILGTVATAFVGLGDTILTSMGVITGSTLVAGLTGLGVVLAGVAVAGVAVHEGMKPAVDTVDEFSNGVYKVSETTKSKLEPVVQEWENAGKRLAKIDFKGIITDKDISYLTKQATKMKEAVLNELSSDRNSELKDLDMMKGLKTVTAEEYTEMLNSTNTYYDETQKKVDDTYARINEITAKYKGKNMPMTQEDLNELQSLYDQLGEIGVTAMSESEQEQTFILNRLKYNQKQLTIEAGSEMLIEAKKNHEKSIEEADQWHADQLASLEKRYADGNGMTKEEYEKQKGIIDKAYQEQIANADTSYNDINTRVKNKLGEQYGYIDESTGKIKTKWQIAWDKMWGVVSTVTGTITSGVSDFVGGIWGIFTGLYDSIIGFQKWFDRKVKEIFGGLGKYAKQFKWNDPSTWISWSSMSPDTGVDIPVTYYGTNSMQNPTVTAFARGGFVPANASFVSPSQSLWTAGEAGKEVVGSYRGKTTVMPLENTSFVQSMKEAVREGVIYAMREANRENPIRVENKVYLDSREIKSANNTQDVIQSNGFIKRR